MSHAEATRFDCLVVGAGPAGASAAEALAARGLSVCLLEKAKLPRDKICAGGLPSKTLKLLPGGLGDLPRREINSIIFTHAGKREHVYRSQSTLVTVVERAAFDELLARRAVAAGAELREGTACNVLREEADGVLAETPSGDVRARAAILATGARSRARVPTRLRRAAPLGTALQVMVPFDGSGKWKDALACDFGAAPRGIAWCFPGPEKLAVGVLTFKPNARGLIDRLREYLRALGLPPGAGPVRGAALATWYGGELFSTSRILLAGDAAGLVNPLTGAGVRRAIISGRLAAETLAGNLQAGRAPAEGFDAAVKQTFAREFGRAARLARLFYFAPGLWYRLAVTSERGTGLIERLLAGRASYDNAVSQFFRRRE